MENNLPDVAEAATDKSPEPAAEKMAEGGEALPPSSRMPQPASLPVAPIRPHLVDTTMFWSASGGGVRRYLQIKRAWLMQHAGWRHTIVAPGALGLGLADCGGLGLPFSGGYRLPLRRGQSANLIERQAPDLIEVGDPYRLAWSALDAGQRLGVPTVAFCHSNIAALAARLAGSGWRARAAHRMAGAYLARTYRQFDLVLAPSEAMVRELRQLGVDRVERQALGVDTGVFHPGRRDPDLRRHLRLPEDSRLLLYVGRFAPEKNLPLLVDAVTRLGPRYFLLAVGSGPLPPKGPRVRVLGHEALDTLLARLVASVDAFVHAGDQETYGLAVLEAMASGIPVVARDAAGLGELLAGGTGIAVPSAKPADWAEAIAEIFTAPQGEMVALARARALALDWKVIMPGMLRRYERLIREGPGVTRTGPQRAWFYSPPRSPAAPAANGGGSATASGAAAGLGSEA